MMSLPEGDGTRPDPPDNLIQSGHLVLGPGAKKDLAGGGAGGIAGAGGVGLAQLTAEQMAAVQKAKKYAMEQSIKMVLMKQTLAHQQNQAKTMQRHQALTLMCRIYVGSINFEVKEDTIRQAFLPFGPIRSISMSWDPITQRHKGFAFVEFEVPEAAQISLEQMNGVVISGRNIKVGRPSNMPQAQTVIEEIMQEATKYDRIYVGSIHQDLTQDDIKSVFEAFGQIKSCELCMTPYPGRHKGYGFIEYETAQAAQDAISSMNLFDLGGQYLRVGRAVTPPDAQATAAGPPPTTVPQVLPTAAAVAAAAATARIQAIDAVTTNLGISSQVVATTNSTTTAVTASAAPAQPRASKFGPPVSATAIAPPPVATLPAVATLPMQPAAAPTQVPVAAAATSSAPIAPSHEQQQQQQPAPQEQQQQQPISEEELKRKHAELQKKLMENAGDSVSLQQQEDMSIKGQEARHLVMQKLMRAQKESTVLLLRNMVGVDEVDDELQDEIQEECSKFGAVDRVVLYHERQSEDEDAEVKVKIFVEFKAGAGAKEAKERLNGRFFGGRRVAADVYDQDLYDHGDLSG